MGQALEHAITQHSDLSLAGTWSRGDDLSEILLAADVLIDFSLPSATELVLKTAVECKTPLVCGVSGLNETQMGLIRAASEQIALLYDRNMSLGVTVLERTVRDAAASLGKDFSISISEVHHVHKKDAPSGTALKLGETIAAALGQSGSGDIEYCSERRGEVPGDHEVTMRSATETLTFSHSVTTRQVFADGALRAARWVVTQPAGQYCMQDVLFGEINSV
jgi:4-hydroxy-tetrahydrodipicolinate reductase